MLEYSIGLLHSSNSKNKKISNNQKKIKLIKQK